MANSNISYVQLVSTFNEWRATTNDLIQDRNILRNAHYVKDNGTFTILANVSNVSPLLTVGNSGNGNVIIGNVLNVVTVNANTFIGRGSGQNLESLILTVYAAANAAANTVRVSQNNGSILSANQLNFVNTSTVTITVTDSGNGNANIAFVSAGGSGISNIAVLANSAGSVNANGLNFINTSTVTVSTGAGSAAGNANIAFSVSGSGLTLKSVNEFLHTNTNVGSANTVDLANANWFAMTLTGSSGNRQFTFTNAPSSGTIYSHNMIIIQDGTGGKTPTWGNTIYWAGGLVPPATTTASAKDIWTFTTYDGGSTYIGTLSVKNAS